MQKLFTLRKELVYNRKDTNTIEYLISVFLFKSALSSLRQFLATETSSKMMKKGVIFLDLRPLDLILGPRPPKYCRNKFMNTPFYLFKIKLIQD